MKAAARRERNDIKKAIKDGTIEAPGPEIIELSELQPMALDSPPEPESSKRPEGGRSGGTGRPEASQRPDGSRPSEGNRRPD